jgi:hypothetical protein
MLKKRIGGVVVSDKSVGNNKLLVVVNEFSF